MSPNVVLYSLYVVYNVFEQYRASFAQCALSVSSNYNQVYLAIIKSRSYTSFVIYISFCCFFHLNEVHLIPFSTHDRCTCKCLPLFPLFLTLQFISLFQFHLVPFQSLFWRLLMLCRTKLIQSGNNFQLSDAKNQMHALENLKQIKILLKDKMSHLSYLGQIFLTNVSQ